MDFENTFATLFRQNPSQVDDNVYMRHQHARPSPGSPHTPSMIFEESPLKKMQVEQEEAQLVRDLKRTQATMYDITYNGSAGQGAALLPTIHVHGPAVFNVACSSPFGADAMKDMVGSCQEKRILSPPSWSNGSTGRYPHRYRMITGSPREGLRNGSCVIREMECGQDGENETYETEENQVAKCPSWLLPKLHALLPQTEGYAVVYLNALPWAVRERVKSWMHMEKRQARLKELLESENVKHNPRSLKFNYARSQMSSHVF